MGVKLVTENFTWIIKHNKQIQNETQTKNYIQDIEQKVMFII